jgi:transposase
VKSTNTRPGNPYLKGALGVAAMSAARSKNTYYSATYRRIASRRGPLKAVVALEHAMLVAIWHMLNDGSLYSDPGDDFYTRRRPERSRQRAVEQLQRMGYAVTLEPIVEVA